MMVPLIPSTASKPLRWKYTKLKERLKKNQLELHNRRKKNEFQKIDRITVYFNNLCTPKTFFLNPVKGKTELFI